MKKLGNPRVVLWILIVALLTYVTYVYKTADNTPPPSPPTVSQATIISDFREMKNIQVPMEPELGGQFYATELLFPVEFRGQVDDVFYVRMEDGHILATVSYRIDELTEEVPTEASYTPLKDHGPGYEPTGEYTVKGLEDQQIEKKNSKN